MTHISLLKTFKYDFIVGPAKFNSKIENPFADEITSFLHDLSKAILKDAKSRNFPDLITFGYWIRKSNLKKIASHYDDIDLRIGHGLAFHVSPNNVPMNFAFSFAFSLLSGNSNIVRLPSREFDQVNLFLNIYKEVSKNYETIKKTNSFIKYDSSEIKLTEYLSLNADARIFWGGDIATKKLKSFDSKEGCIDIIFSDKRSGSVIHADKALELDEKKLNQLCKAIYNDIFLMDQNACSSPKIFFWLSKKADSQEKAKKLIWPKVSKIAKNNYEINPSQVMDKLNNAFKNVANFQSSGSVLNYENFLNIHTISNESYDEDIWLENSGYIFEININSLVQISPFINSKFQTLTYFGFSKDQLKDFIFNTKPSGIDRLVPIGTALEIGQIWDGYDLIRSLSRIIQIS